MTITRETLELAAKPMGRLVVKHRDGTFWQNFRGVGVQAWQPHIDGNDAVELADKIGAQLLFNIQMVVVTRQNGSGIAARWPEDCDNWKEAVTMVAAEVQRAKEGGE